MLGKSTRRLTLGLLCLVLRVQLLQVFLRFLWLLLSERHIFIFQTELLFSIIDHGFVAREGLPLLLG